MLVVLSAVMMGDVALLSLIGASLQDVEGWATFAPDLVVGLITTGVLGLVVWSITHRIETNLESRNAQRTARNRWSVIQRRVTNAVNTLDFADDVTDASRLGPVADALIQILENEPLAEWAQLLNSAEILQLNATLARLERTVSMGTAVNDSIRFWFVTSSWSVKVSLEQVRAIQIGRALGFDRTLTARTFGVKARVTSKLLSEMDSRASSDLEDKLVVYALNRRTAEESVERLRSPRPAALGGESHTAEE